MHIFIIISVFNFILSLSLFLSLYPAVIIIWLVYTVVICIYIIKLNSGQRKSEVMMVGLISLSFLSLSFLSLTLSLYFFFSQKMCVCVSEHLCVSENDKPHILYM